MSCRLDERILQLFLLRKMNSDQMSLEMKLMDL
jgi:hypothetical protein